MLGSSLCSDELIDATPELGWACSPRSYLSLATAICFVAERSRAAADVDGGIIETDCDNASLSYAANLFAKPNNARIILNGMW